MQILTQQVRSSRDSAFLTSSLVTLLLPVCGPHSEGPGYEGGRLMGAVRVLPGRFRYVPEQGSRGALDWVISLALLSPPISPTFVVWEAAYRLHVAALVTSK